VDLTDLGPGIEFRGDLLELEFLLGGRKGLRRTEKREDYEDVPAG